MLINVWQKILTGLEDCRAGVVLTSIDYAKAFNRLSFQHCLAAFAKQGASSPVLRLIATFLSGRTMSVRVASTWSAPREVTGGCPQGSILGVLLFNLTTDDLEDSSLYVEHVGRPPVGLDDEEEEDYDTAAPDTRAWGSPPPGRPVLYNCDRPSSSSIGRGALDGGEENQNEDHGGTLARGSSLSSAAQREDSRPETSDTDSVRPPGQSVVVPSDAGVETSHTDGAWPPGQSVAVLSDAGAEISDTERFLVLGRSLI